MSKKFINSLTPDRLSDYRKAYDELGYVVWNSFFDVETAEHWAGFYRHLPEIPVYVGRKRHCIWIEQGFDRPQIAFDGLFLDKDFQKLVCVTANLPNLSTTKIQIWINRYLPNNIVPAHKDATGKIQLLICLQETKDKQGGEFYINKSNIQLNTGDAVLFSANKLIHGVRRIKSLQTENSGFSRITCVVRMFD